MLLDTTRKNLHYIHGLITGRAILVYNRQGHLVNLLEKTTKSWTSGKQRSGSNSVRSNAPTPDCCLQSDISTAPKTQITRHGLNTYPTESPTILVTRPKSLDLPPQDLSTQKECRQLAL